METKKQTQTQILKKNKHIFFFILISFAFFSFIRKRQSDYKEKEIIVWAEDNKLNWDYFKGKYKGSNKNAGTFSLIYSLYTNDALTSINIRACFVKKESWKKDKSPSEYLLNHEQRHFDLTEIYARKLRRILADTIFATAAIAKKAIQNIIRENNKNLNASQDLYDKESNHSLNKESQLVWDNKIDLELKVTSSYTNNIVNIRLR